MSNLIFISNIEEYDNLHDNVRFRFICANCNNEVEREKRKEREFKMLCKKCKTKETFIKKYGVENPFQAEEVKEKIRQVNLERYGVEVISKSQVVKEKIKQTNLERYGAGCTFQSALVKEKSKQTCLKRYGVENPHQNEEVKEKTKQTNLERFGVENAMHNEFIKEKVRQTCIKKYGVGSTFESKEIQEKSKQTCMQRYGVHFPMQSKKIQEKSKQTCLKNFGVEYPTQSDEVKEKSRATCLKKYGVEISSLNKEVQEKAKQTCLEKYGVECFFQSDIFKKFRQINYIYNGISFDSSWELAFYIYYNDHNFKVIRTPCSIDYSYEGTEHKYFPDFKIKNRIFEIKGPQFFNENGELINPYDSSENIRTAAKHKCMLENNIIIIKDCSKYLDYVNNKYGKDFLKLCRTENAEAV